MEAHAGSITIGARRVTEPRRTLSQLRESLRRRRQERAERSYILRMNGIARSVPGSEHTHLLHRPRGF